MPKNLSIVEAKTHLSDCIREVEQGGGPHHPAWKSGSSPGLRGYPGACGTPEEGRPPRRLSQFGRRMEGIRGSRTPSFAIETHETS